MDFSNDYSQFAGTQPYGQFVPSIPSLTSQQSHHVNSNKFAPTASDSFEALPSNNQFTNFSYPQNFGTSQSVTQGQSQQQPSQPQQPLSTQHHPDQHQYHQNTNSTPHRPPVPHTNNVYGQQQPAQSGQESLAHDSSNGMASQPGNMPMTETGVDEFGLWKAGSDDDESLTPAQSRRKAQNRAAQRAFRERKERHVKDLEIKLAGMAAAQQEASLENNRLRRDLQKLSTENEILRATSSRGANGSHASRSPEPLRTGPMRYNPTDFYTSVLRDHTNKQPSHRIVTNEEGERLLAAGAAWDFITSHSLVKNGQVDLAMVSDQLKNFAKCDGQGPVFSEKNILQALEQSVANGSDDLL